MAKVSPIRSNHRVAAPSLRTFNNQKRKSNNDKMDFAGVSFPRLTIAKAILKVSVADKSMNEEEQLTNTIKLLNTLYTPPVEKERDYKVV